jgi:hypothetical protein
LQEGVDYHESPPVDANRGGAEPQWRPMFVLVKDTASGIGFDHQPDDRYHYVEQLAADFSNAVGGGITSANVRPLDGRMGFELGVTPRHYFALDTSFDNDSLNTTVPAPFDFKTFVCTGFFETESRFKVVIDELFDGEKFETGRTLIINVPDAELWLIADATVIDIDADGDLVKIAPVEGAEELRNDLAKIEAVAAGAAVWYGKKRQAVEIGINRIGLFVELGTILTDINTVVGREPVRTMITGRFIDFTANDGGGKTTIVTGWGNADYAPEA